MNHCLGLVHMCVTSLVEELSETLDSIWKCTHKEAAYMKPTTDVSDKCCWSAGRGKEPYLPVQGMDFL